MQEYPFDLPGATENKSALDYLHEIQQWHDKYFGLSTLLELATEKEFGGTVTEFHSLSTCLSAAFKELRSLVMSCLIYCRLPAERHQDLCEKTAKEETSRSRDNLQ